MDEMFAGLSMRAARPGRTYAAPASLLAHAVGLTLLVALSVSRVTPLPTPATDPLYIPIYGAPAAPPPLPKGDAGATRPMRPAFTQKIEGTVTVEILIDAAGRVRRPRVIQSIPMLDDAVLAAVVQWVFAPATKDGRPVATLALVPMKFQIH